MHRQDPPISDQTAFEERVRSATKVVILMLSKWAFGGVVALLLFVVVYGRMFGQDYDATDNADSRVRSGMALYTDHGTGCEYLGNPRGGITPRLDVDGRHMGCRRGR